VKRLLLPSIVGGASAWLATGSLSRDYLVGYGADASRVFRFPNSPDVDFFREGAARADRAAVRGRLGAGAAPVVLFVARLIGVKRADLLIRAAALLAERGVPATIWIAGDGPEGPALRDAAARSPGTDIRFLGNVQTADLPAIYAAADVFVLPSDHEPWGAVVGEAMACGLPIVLSDRVGSAPDLVEPGGNGAVFPAGDAEALSRAIEGILSDADLRKRMAALSAERIEGFTHRLCAREFLEAVEAARRSGS
jgi:glycosyltransferase involved in cell wall biosynthesis